MIEAVSEDLELKTQIFQELDRVASPEDILASNTSALSMTEVAARTRRPDRIIGLHFLHPVPKVPLVEVVRGLKTSDATYRAALEFVELGDKERQLILQQVAEGESVEAEMRRESRS